MVVISSLGWTGFGTNILNPAANARVRSSILTKAVKATAGIWRLLCPSSSLTLLINEKPSFRHRQVAYQNVGLVAPQ